MSLVLALELAIAPVAMARADGDTAEDLLPETPVADPLEEGGAAAQLAAAGNYDYVRYSVSVPTYVEYEQVGPMTRLAHYRLVDFNNQLEVENMQNVTELAGSVWLAMGRKLETGIELANPSNTSRYFFIPSSNGSERIPDMEFSGAVNENSGYYVGGAAGDRALLEDGVEALVSNADTIPYDWGYGETYMYIPTPYEGHIITMADTYDTELMEYDDTLRVYTLPIEYRWQASRKADVTALAMTLHGATGSTPAEENTTVLTQVFTKDPLASGFNAATDVLTLDQLADGASVLDQSPDAVADHELWLVVGKDQKSLDLRFETFEPFFNYTNNSADPDAKCPVAVTYRFDEGTENSLPLDRDAGGNLTCTFTPQPEWKTSTNEFISKNSLDDPARGHWYITGIPLVKITAVTYDTTGQTVEETEEPGSVTVTLTVTPNSELDLDPSEIDPKNSTAETYTIHVIRRGNPEELEVRPGNSPLGMLRRDTGTSWDSGGKVTLAEAEQAFIDNRNFRDSSARPVGEENQNGNLYEKQYTKDCWGSYDLDIDPTALVVYQDSAFVDPGVTFQDSVGRRVDLSKAIYRGTVTRTIKLRTPRNGMLNADSYTAPSDECWYNGDTKTLSATQVSQTLRSMDEPVDLRGLMVLPGIYDIVYDYTDPDSLASLSSTNGVTNAPTYTAQIVRKLMVLPIPGDVDMNGAVNLADAIALKNHLTAWQGTATIQALLLAKYRVFDLDGNSLIEAADYQRIYDGFQPEFQRGSASDYFYFPLPSGVEAIKRPVWSEVSFPNSGGTLTLEYLGVEKGTASGEYTSNPCGPWDTKVNASTGGLERVSLPNAEGDNSVFWMGVKLTGSPRNGQAVDNFSISLIYNSEYLEPAAIYTSAEKASSGSADPSAFDGWSYTLRKYNIRDLGNQNGKTIWTGHINDYSSSASTRTRAFATHYSKVVGNLESNLTSGNANPLREMVFSIEQVPRGNRAILEDGYVLVVPFKLTQQPPDSVDRDVCLVELDAGMRDFTMKTQPEVTSGTAGVAGALGGTLRTMLGSLASVLGLPMALPVTSGGEGAFSAQSTIYGDSTQNLREEIRFDYASPKGLVPIGQDNSPRTTLAPGVCGDEYSAGVALYGQTDDVVKDLPPGLNYDRGRGIVSGVPILPGQYDFTVAGNRYRIVVTTRTLSYRPVNADTYYGETEYRGSAEERAAIAEEAEQRGDPIPRNFKFQYKITDLSKADQAYAKTLGYDVDAVDSFGSPIVWRDGAELEDILNRTVTVSATNRDYTFHYTPPTFAAFVGDLILQNYVSQNTTVSRQPYVISTQGTAVADAYTFQQESTALLGVAQRPVYIHHLVIPAADNKIWIYNDGNVAFSGRTAIDSDTTDIALELAPDSDTGGKPLTGDAKVEGDKLSIMFSGRYHRIEDHDTATAFIMDALVEYRDLDISHVELTNEPGTAGSNYYLKSNDVSSPEDNDVKGEVRLRGVTEMVLVSCPNEFSGTRTLTYGVQISTPNALKVRVRKGEGSTSTSVGEYEYSAPQLEPLQIHFNWVTAEEYEEGIKEENINSVVGSGYYPKDSEIPEGITVNARGDSRPYGTYRDNYLYPDMTGWRVCAIVSKYGAETDASGAFAVEYIKVYSPSIEVHKKVLTLTPKNATRYYGEELQDSQLTYSFLVSDLATQDQKLARRGTREELENILKDDAAFQSHPLTFTMVDGDGNPVTATTSIKSGGECRIVLGGGESNCYDFRYKGSDGSVSTGSGFANLVIQPRPIIVKSIQGNGDDGSFGDIYADTTNLYLRGVEAKSGKVEFILPTYDPEEGITSYYTATSDGSMYTDHSCTFAPGTTQAVLDGDQVTIRYQVTFLADQGHYVWTGFANNFFDNDPFNADPDHILQKPVQVENIELIGAQRDNYVLVYQDAYSVQVHTAADAVLRENQMSAPRNNGRVEDWTYYISGTGNVRLRPIENLVITSLGKMTYTYGEEFAPGQAASHSGVPMEVRVEYSTTYDNDIAHNVHEEVVRYGLSRIEGGKRYTTFDDRGFVIGYIRPGQTKEQGYAADQHLTSGDIMVPSDHDGVALFVTGQRSPDDPLIYSKVTNDVTGEVKFPEPTVTVKKGSLTLYAEDAHRIFGEANPTFSYTFRISDLAKVDQERLREAGKLPADDIGTEEMLEFLDSAGQAGLGVSMATTAVKTSPVDAGNPWGAYPIRMSVASQLTNYTVKTANAILYVYPRPISINGIVSDDDHPVYTIFSNTNVRNFTTQLCSNPAELPHVTVGCGVNTPTATIRCSDGRARQLPITNGVGLLEDDELHFTVNVGYGELQNITETNQVVDVVVRVTQMISSNTARNYSLNSTGGDFSGRGAAKLRTIQSITIKRAPYKLSYTYGESMDLYGLQVQVGYAVHSGEVTDTVNVNYVGHEQFQSMGLYVNYWDPDEKIPASTDADNTAWKMIQANYRTARTGDHLTIAPTHDTQGLKAGSSTRKDYQFSANGKALIISAFQAGEEQKAVRPVIVGEELTGGNFEGAPLIIHVAPLRLQYTLSATDKTYNGDCKTAGTLTLTNVFRMDGMVDVQNTSGVTDVVYVPIGAGYEGQGDDHHAAGYDSLKRKVSLDGRVSFTTGTYSPNREAPLLANGKVSWTTGYVWGSNGDRTALDYNPSGRNYLTFTFANPNVHYEDNTSNAGKVGNETLAEYWHNAEGRFQKHNTVTTVWDKYNDVNTLPVEVTNMVLEGPDAANYTWGESEEGRTDRTEVLITTRGAEDRGQAAVPFATIHRANRPTIQDVAPGVYPTLQVDQHTNVVRLLFDQGLLKRIGEGWNGNNELGTSDDYQDELHFEYALLYLDSNTQLLAQWAGKQGNQGYQDTMFFGGETTLPQATADTYIPNTDQLPKADKATDKTTYKGQRYAWAEEDTGVSERGYVEDAGYSIIPEAYPGGASFQDKYGNTVRAEDAYWYYDLYTTDRVNLPRDTVFYPMVRLSATHNYNASGILTGDDTRKVSAATLDAAIKAVAAVRFDTTEVDYARAMTAAVFEEGAAMTAAALQVSQDKMDYDAALGESNRWPDVPPSPISPAEVAIKTYRQRLDILSSAELRSLDTGDKENYTVETLEAVWFTDTLIYDHERYLNAVVYNRPTRYFGFYWDRDLSAKLNFNEKALNFTEEIVGIQIRERQPDKSTMEKYITVNTLDETVNGYVAKIYAQVAEDDGRQVRFIHILPTALYARVGDEPYQLTVITTPEIPSNREYSWFSSDVRVATVSQEGLVVFRGPGVCTITVTTTNGRACSITVVVSEVISASKIPDSFFNFFLTDAWMPVDEDGKFHPTMTMTRWEVTELLDRFLDPKAPWAPASEMHYVDIKGDEPRIEALRRLTGAGVISGVPGNAFAGDQLATRAEFATMLARLLRVSVPDTQGMVHLFADSGEEDTWAYAYIDAVGKTGAIRGVGGGNFAPSRYVTREEAAAILARLLTVKIDEDDPDLQKPSDMTPANWSYKSVLQAINSIVFPSAEDNAD